jgi:hypothetical protein
LQNIIGHLNMILQMKLLMNLTEDSICPRTRQHDEGGTQVWVCKGHESSQSGCSLRREYHVE